jgi:O-antigen/teichoic acid export membrane protein
MSSLRLARGALWNLLGLLLPLAIALVAIPPLVRNLGTERFGVLSLAWALVGYFTLFDLGIGTAVTRMLSTLRGAGREAEAMSWFWTAALLTLGLGALGTLALAAGATPLARSVLNVPPALQAETRGILLVLAASLPFVTVSAVGSGALAAYQRFGALNAVRVPLGLLSFLAPLAVSTRTHDLVAVGLSLALTRALGAAAFLLLCGRTLPGGAARPRFLPGAIRPLLGFGGWMTVSAITGPFMVYLDRFLIGALLSLAAVAWYTTPYDLTSRVLVLPQSIVGVLFPAIAEGHERDPARVAFLLDWGLRAVAAMVFPLTFLLALFAPEALRLWLGPEFAAHGAPVLRWVAAGVFLNAGAQLALSVVQASGRPRWSAVLHAVELPLYLAALVLLVRARGIEGAALAWFARVLVDVVVLFAMAVRRLPEARPTVRRNAALAVVALAALALGCVLPSLALRAAFAGATLAAGAWLAWRHVVVPGRPLLGRLASGART